MNQNRSVATIEAPEFLNLEPTALNPGISSCEIKVFYVGENRNGSCIDKNTAIQMANSLPGTPIVGAYREETEDFTDHGDRITIENGEIKFSCTTIPYGFVSPNAEVWFKTFIDTDVDGKETKREYLMTTGYLWTGQYPEITKCITSGKGQSMELDSETLKGQWATNNNTGVDIFIINDAIFSKLCVLGDDVEPCFEGASVSSPDISKDFSKDVNFTKSLSTMMTELQFALNAQGGSDMAELETEFVEEVVEQEPTTSFEESDDSADAGDATETEETAEVEAEAVEVEDGVAVASEEVATFEESGEDDEEKEEVEDKEEEKEDEKPLRKAYTALIEECESLKAENASLQAELAQMTAYKVAQENAEKDALISRYHMLDDDAKAEIVAHKEEYSLEEIEAKLAILYVETQVDFSTLTGEEDKVGEEVESDDPITTFSLEDDNAAELVPDFVLALREAKNGN